MSLKLEEEKACPLLLCNN